MRTAMMISPHADDAAAFCGGTLAKFAAEVASGIKSKF